MDRGTKRPAYLSEIAEEIGIELAILGGMGVGLLGLAYWANTMTGQMPDGATIATLASNAARDLLELPANLYYFARQFADILNGVGNPDVPSAAYRILTALGPQNIFQPPAEPPITTAVTALSQAFNYGVGIQGILAETPPPEPTLFGGVVHGLIGSAFVTHAFRKREVNTQ